MSDIKTPNKLKLEITVEEANLILTALSKGPYSEVSAIIAEVQEQLTPQLKTEDDTTD